MKTINTMMRQFLAGVLAVCLVAGFQQTFAFDRQIMKEKLEQEVKHFVSAAGGAAPQTKQEAPPGARPIRVETTLVQVEVGVTNQKGEPLPALKSNDFKIYENGVEQPIAFFEQAGTAYNLTLLLQPYLDSEMKVIFGSPSYDKSAKMQEIGNTLIGALRPEDRISIMSLSNALRVHLPLSSSKEDAEQALSDSNDRKDFYTDLYDLNFQPDRTCENLLKLRDFLAKNSNGQRNAVIFIVQDNAGTHCEIGAGRHGDIIEAGWPIFVLQLVDSKNSYSVDLWNNTAHSYSRGTKKAIRQSWSDLAHATGGEYFQIHANQDTSSILAHILARLQGQYRIGYYLTNKTEGWKSINVKISKKKSQIHTVAGFSYKPTRHEESASAIPLKTDLKSGKYFLTALHGLSLRTTNRSVALMEDRNAKGTIRSWVSGTGGPLGKYYEEPAFSARKQFLKAKKKNQNLREKWEDIQMQEEPPRQLCYTMYPTEYPKESLSPGLEYAVTRPLFYYNYGCSETGHLVDSGRGASTFLPAAFNCIGPGLDVLELEISSPKGGANAVGNKLTIACQWPSNSVIEKDITLDSVLPLLRTYFDVSEK